MKLILGRWSALTHHFAPRPSVPCLAGVSGGSTSGMMAALLNERVVMSFQNTGREALRTYSFLEELGAALERPIRWLEYRPPATRGGRPCESRFAIVSPTEADKSGMPFELMMEALNAFRARNGKGPIAPWWRSRICTAYMKSRTARAYAAALGWSAWTELAGLRADEPKRVKKLGNGDPKHIKRLAPLADAGITKTDVAEFWEAQSFKLGLPEYMGNCTGCFLKDQSDLSRATMQPETDVDWWARMQERWPMFGGRDFAGYRQLASEAPARLWMEAELRAGRTPQLAQWTGNMDHKRFRLVVIQERKRLAGQAPVFSCECEGSSQLAGLDDEDGDQLVLNLPEAA